MYEFTGPLLKSELSYREGRVKDGIAKSRRRGPGAFPRVRRQHASADSTR